MLDSGCVTFSDVATGRREVPVKSTFIHFDAPLQPPTAHQRSTTCPPRLSPCFHAAGTDGWELAMMQELCQAFVPRLERTGETKTHHAYSQGCLDTAGTPPGPKAQDRAETAPWDDTADNVHEDAVKQHGPEELEMQDTDRISEASTKESSGAATPEVPGTPNTPDSEEATLQQRGSHRKRAAQGRAEKRASAAAARQYGYEGGGGSGGSRNESAVATKKSEGEGSWSQFKGKGLSHFERIEVGIEDDRDFRVVQRLIGPRGKHMQDITQQCKGAKVWIIGRGSRSWEDSVGPLVVCVGATSRPAFDSAAGLVRELLDRVHEDHRRFRR